MYEHQYTKKDDTNDVELEQPNAFGNIWHDPKENGQAYLFNREFGLNPTVAADLANDCAELDIYK